MHFWLVLYTFKINDIYFLKLLKAHGHPLSDAIYADNNNNVIWYYLLRFETKIKVVLKDLSKFKIHEVKILNLRFRPLLHNKPQ